ncbi:MAG: hypothetical protein JWN24_2466 [Phycisphaerales bacterium]|jgi:cytoskeletal protein CcmA (bactofilin family)|nr:hypothetical protein [Phycisphaerales bacterium]
MAEAGNQEFPTILGPDASFKGELNFEKGMRLMGRFEGKITTPGRLHIAKEAKMSADVDAGAIIVEGEVQGNLSASERVELKQSARYQGDLTASKLVVEEGAAFVGHVSVGPDTHKGASTRPAPHAPGKPIQGPPPQPQHQPQGQK